MIKRTDNCSVLAQFLSLFEVHPDAENGDAGKWEAARQELSRFDAPRLFWYPASGLDTGPMNPQVRLTQSWRDNVDLFVYTDYAPRYPERFWHDYRRLGNQRVTWDHLHVMQMIPLAISDAGLARELEWVGRPDFANRELHPFWYVHLAAPEHEEEFELLFAPVDHHAFLRAIIKPLDLRFEWVCGKCDGGGGKGGAWCSVNDAAGELLRTLMDTTALRPDWWITDRWERNQVEQGLTRFAQEGQEQWRGYNSPTILYKVAAEPSSLPNLPLPRGELRSASIGTHLTVSATYSGDMWPHVAQLPAAIVPAAYPDSTHVVSVRRRKHRNIRTPEEVLAFLTPYLEHFLATSFAEAERECMLEIGTFAFGAEELRYNAATFLPLSRWLEDIDRRVHLRFFLVHPQDWMGSIWK